MADKLLKKWPKHMAKKKTREIIWILPTLEDKIYTVHYGQVLWTAGVVEGVEVDVTAYVFEEMRWLCSKTSWLMSPVWPVDVVLLSDLCCFNLIDDTKDLFTHLFVFPDVIVNPVRADEVVVLLGRSRVSLYWREAVFEGTALRGL